jgi:hypothetical protein
MKASEQGGLRLACEIVWSLDAGVTITILLALLRAAHIAPDATNILLRPGMALVAAVYGASVPSNAAFALSDALIYGLLFFVGVHLWQKRHRPGFGGAVQAERRHGSRVALDAPVFVYGWREDEPFSETTETLNVSELGGFIPLSVKVAPSQELVLTNLQTNQDMRCRVARSTIGENGKSLAGLTFLEASPGFWQIEFLSTAPLSGQREKADPSVARAASG